MNPWMTWSKTLTDMAKQRSWAWLQNRFCTRVCKNAYPQASVQKRFYFVGPGRGPAVCISKNLWFVRAGDLLWPWGLFIPWEVICFSIHPVLHDWVWVCLTTLPLQEGKVRPVAPPLRSLQSLKLSEGCALSTAEMCTIMEPNLTADLHFD